MTIRRSAKPKGPDRPRFRRTVVPEATLIVCWSRWRQAAMIALSSGIIAIGCFGWMLPSGALDDLPLPLARALAVMVAGLGAIALIAAIQRMISGALIGRIDARGILWARWSKRTIPWSEIAGYAVQDLTLGEGGTIRFISLWLFEPTKWPADCRITRLVNWKRLPGYGHLSIDARGTDRTLAQLEQAIEAIGRRFPIA